MRQAFALYVHSFPRPLPPSIAGLIFHATASSRLHLKTGYQVAEVLDGTAHGQQLTVISIVHRQLLSAASTLYQDKSPDPTYIDNPGSKSANYQSVVAKSNLEPLQIEICK